jgi:hypothetical protein
LAAKRAFSSAMAISSATCSIILQQQDVRFLLQWQLVQLLRQQQQDVRFLLQWQLVKLLVRLFFQP